MALSLKRFKNFKNAGFTLMEVLVSLGILGGIVLIVVYMNINNLNEILRHNAESYINLLAEEQFSALVAYRNQVAFDKDKTTNWESSILPLRDASCFYLSLDDNTWKINTLLGAHSWQEVNKIVNDSGSVRLNYRLCLEPVYKDRDSTQKEEGLVKVKFEVKWQDRFGREKIKKFYTLLGNYL